MPTAVHVGDGNDLQYGFDFLADGKDVYVLDIGKLVDSIGEAEDLDQSLLDAISKRELDEYIKDNDIYLDSISSRKIYNYYNYEFKATNIIKSQIHDAFGRPYIPGSSIKGAIRTAIVASMASKVDKNQYNLNHIEQNLCGHINSDFFRFIRVGDAVIEDGCEIVASLSRLTQSYKNDIKQYVEAINFKKAGSATFALAIDSENYKAAKKSSAFGNKLGNMPDEVQNIGSLLKLINGHTVKLVKDEIDKWRTFNNNCWARKYVKTLGLILDECNGVDSGKECVLRIGMGSGKRFITGSWSENVSKFYNKERHKMENNLVPRTRTFIVNGNTVDLLGFVKLRIKSVK